MGSDTDRLPQLDEDSGEFVETIVLEGSDIMTTREFRKLVDPDAEPSGPDDDLEAMTSNGEGRQE